MLSLAWAILSDEIDSLLLTKAGGHSVILLRVEALRFHPYRVSAWLQLREVESARVIGCGDSLQPGLRVMDRHRGARHRRAAGIAHLPDNRARSFSLRKCFQWMQYKNRNGKNERRAAYRR